MRDDQNLRLRLFQKPESPFNHCGHILSELITTVTN